MLYMAFAVLFFIPATYLARSKGYKAFPIFAGTVVFSVVLEGVVYMATELLYTVMLAIPPLLSLLIVWLLPEKEGAPGKRYLKITFACPECEAELTFPRSKEGAAQLCPQCKEIITIPTDEFSPKPSISERSKPQVDSGRVCFASYGDEMFALQMQALFEDAGIASEIMDGTAGGSMPLFSGSQGFNISIDIADWDKAVQVEVESQPAD